MRTVIPFESQAGSQTCGAASLVMVYRSFGLVADQETVVRETERSRRAVQLAAHARSRGLRAAVVQFREPLPGLRGLRQNCPDIRVILNHRLSADSRQGHFSVVVDLLPDDDGILMHDPWLGPNRRWMLETLDRLWNGPGGEVRGRVAILIRQSGPEEIRPIRCGQCGELADGAAFQEILPFCERTFCPHCDHPLAEVRPGETPFSR